MKLVFFDIETHSELDVTKCGAWAYNAHPSTDVLCIQYKYAQFPIDLWLPKSTLPFAFEDSECFYVAHNVEFEYCVWKFILHPRYGWPEPPPPERWIDSAAVARYFGYPGSLEKASEAMGIGKKDMEGKRVMMKLSKPRRPSATNPDLFWTPETKPDDFDRLYKYCAIDVVQSYRIIKKLGILPPREQKMWVHNFHMSIRGIPVDVEFAKNVLLLVDKHVNYVNAQLTDITNGIITSATQHVRFAKFLNLPSVARPNLEALQKSTGWKQIGSTKRQVIKLRLQAGRTSTSKLVTLIDQAVDGCIHGQLIINAAGTGRYAGVGTQIHNMFRTTLKPKQLKILVSKVRKMYDVDSTYFWIKRHYKNVIEALSNLVRPAIKAPKGKALVAVDYAAVEARIAGWLADDEILIRLFRDFDKGTAVEPYCDMAEYVYGYPIDKNTHEMERFIGKQIILGCIFGMSPERFQMMCESYGTPIEFTLAKKGVNAFRTRFKEVKKAWSNIQDAVLRVIKFEIKVEVCHCTWELIHDPIRALRITLPTGKRLHFINPTVGYGPAKWNKDQIIDKIYYWGIGENKQWMKLETYGASLFETITQGLAAEFLKDTLLKLDRINMPVVFHVHDEPVACVSLAKSKKALRRIIQIMGKPPVDAPIKAEGKVIKRYRKA